MGKYLKVIFFVLTSLGISEASSQTVYTTKTGEKYHTRTCRYLKYSRVKIDIKKAKEIGFDACSVCKPSTLSSQQNFHFQTKNT